MQIDERGNKKKISNVISVFREGLDQPNMYTEPLKNRGVRIGSIINKNTQLIEKAIIQKRIYYIGRYSIGVYSNDMSVFNEMVRKFVYTFKREALDVKFKNETLHFFMEFQAPSFTAQTEDSLGAILFCSMEAELEILSYWASEEEVPIIASITSKYFSDLRNMPATKSLDIGTIKTIISQQEETPFLPGEIK
jgi:hypothetical protein